MQPPHSRAHAEALATWTRAFQQLHKEILRVYRGGERNSGRKAELAMAMDVARIRLEALTPPGAPPS